jgi:uncharacterized protein YqgC (DUF456 family)
MEIALYILSGLLLLTGIAGAMLPVLPGPPISFIAVLVLHFTERYEFSTQFLIIFGAIAAFITVLDYVIPIWGTKRFGGSKAGVRGSTVGLILGVLFFPPLGIIIGPFIGAVVAELIFTSDDFQKALRSGFGSLIGFLLGTGLKLAFGLMAVYYAVVNW